MASSRSRLAKLGVGTADPVDTLLRFADFDPGIRRELRTIEGTYGNFYRDGNVVRESRVAITPTGTFEPTAAELAYLLAWGLGAGSGSGTVTYVPQVNVEARNIYWKPEVGDQFFIPSVGLDKLTLSAAVGEPLTASCEFVAMTYDDTRDNFPAITPDVTTQPFMLADLTAVGGAWTFGGSTRQPNGFSLRIDNMIDRNRYFNSLYLTRVQKLDQQFGLTFDVASGDNISLWDNGIAGVAFTATFVNINTGADFVITAPAIKFPGQSPRHVRGGEGMVSVDGMLLRSGGTGHPLTCTLSLS